MSYSADETYDVYNETHRKARKAHICNACKETIRSGDMYTVVSTVYDGSANSLKRCARCQKLHEHLRDLCADLGEMWPQEDLNCGLDYEKEWGQAPPPEIEALAFALPGDELLAAEKSTPTHTDTNRREAWLVVEEPKAK